MFSELSEEENELKNKATMLEENIYPTSVVIGSNQPEMFSYAT